MNVQPSALFAPHPREKPMLSILTKCWCDAQYPSTRYSLTWCSVDGGKERRDTVRMKAVPSVIPVWKTESVTHLYVIRFDVKPFSARGGDEALREISSGKLYKYPSTMHSRE